MEDKSKLFFFDPKTHIGGYGNDIWPSVTQLERTFGLIDFSMVPEERLAAKSLLGTRVHAATVLIDNGTLDEEHFNKTFPECVPYLEAYRKFRIIEGFDVEHKENRYFSRKWKFHGAPDESGFNIGKFGKDACLIDYKCTYAMYPACGPQLAAYSMLLEENLGVKIKKRFGLLLKPTGNYDLVPFKDKSDFTDIQACLVLWWARVNKYKTLNPKKELSNGTNA